MATYYMFSEVEDGDDYHSTLGVVRAVSRKHAIDKAQKIAQMEFPDAQMWGSTILRADDERASEAEQNGDLRFPPGRKKLKSV